MSYYFHKASPELLMAADYESIAFLEKIKADKEKPVLINVKRPRNSRFHRKMMALLTFAYENKEFSTVTYKGVEIETPFDLFRKNMIVWAGFYTLGANIHGELRYIPDSISYEKCSQEKAERIYNGLLDVIGKKLFQGSYTPEQLDAISEKYLNFCGRN